MKIKNAYLYLRSNKLKIEIMGLGNAAVEMVWTVYNVEDIVIFAAGVS